MGEDELRLAAPGLPKVGGTHQDEMAVRIGVGDAGRIKRTAFRCPPKRDEQFAIRPLNDGGKGRVIPGVVVEDDVLQPAEAGVGGGIDMRGIQQDAGNNSDAGKDRGEGTHVQQTRFLEGKFMT